MGLNWRNALRIIAALVAALVVSVLLLWRFREDIKSALLSGISGRITEMVKQRVVIGDLSFGPSTSLTLRALRIDSPEGVGEGALLTIDRMVLSLEVGALLSGRLHLPRVEIVSPELMLSKDGQGRFNISDGLMRLLTVESGVKYRIDRLTIEGGAAVFRSEAAYRFDQVALNLTNLSSEEGTKTLVTGSAGYARGTIGVDGWAYLRDDANKFSLSLSVKDAVFPQRGAMHKDLPSGAEQMVFTFDVQAEGDTVKNIALTMHGRMMSRGRLPSMKKELAEIRFDGRAFYHIPADMLTIHDVRLYGGQVVAAGLSGVIRDVREAPLYDLDIKIERIDVSALPLPEQMSAEGVITSDALHVTGKLGKGRPYAKGALLLSDGSLRSKIVALDQLHATVSFDAGKEVSLSADAASKMTRMGGYALHEPSDLTLSIRAEGEAAAITLSGSVALSAVRVNLEGNRDVRAERVYLQANGALKGDTYTGETALKVGSLQYDGYGMENAGTAFTIDYSPGETRLKEIMLDAEGVRSSANQIAIRRLEKGSKWALEAKGLNIVDSVRKIEVGDADLSLSVNVSEKEGSGAFSLAVATFHGFRSQGISGRGSLSEREFSIEIPRAEIGGGKLRVTAEGKTSAGLFPVSADIAAESVDAAYLLKALSSFVKIPYSVTGTIKKVAFRGTAESLDSLHGHASLEGRNITVLENEKGRAFARDASFTMETVFKGRDLEFNVQGTSGPVSATASGLARDYSRDEREVTVSASLPETRIADIRTSLWDVFPDSLLYLGLEGSLSSDMTVRLGENRLSGQGELRLKDIRIEGENGEYSVGPVNGIVPVLYSDSQKEGPQVSLVPHVRSRLESVRAHYAGELTGEGYHKVSLGSLRYGFPLLDDVTLWVKQQGASLNIGRFDAKIFGGRLNASGIVDVAGGPDYRLGILLEGMSLAQLCDRIEPIRGYLSGKVDGIGTFRGSGPGLARIVGAADFWTYRTKEEPTKISREFLQKLGGPSMKAFLGDRPFNKGDMRILVKDGFVLFRELDISNRNILGVQDLSVKVAPLHNRIAIDHLLWSLAEAGERAKEGGSER